jgi:hypothetical protein
MKRELIISTEDFYKNLSNLIASGVTFTSTENNGIVTINFLGGY